MAKRTIWRNPTGRRRARLITACLLGLGLLIGLSAYVIHNLNSPAVGTIAKSAPATAAITDSTDYSTLNSGFLSLLYPSGFLADYPPAKASQAIEYHYYVSKNSKGSVDGQLEIYLRQLPKGSLVLDADYKNYQSRPGSFALSSRNIQGEAVDIARSTKGQPETAALWEHGNYLLVIKLKGAPHGQNVDDVIKTMLGSVQWLKR